MKCDLPAICNRSSLKRAATALAAAVGKLFSMQRLIFDRGRKLAATNRNSQSAPRIGFRHSPAAFAGGNRRPSLVGRHQAWTRL